MHDLRGWRLRAKLTQAELAVRSGLRQATISALENGRSRAHPGTVLALAAALDTDVQCMGALLSTSWVASGQETGADPVEQMGRGWLFLEGLDADLRSGLARALVAEWTHSSTALEGNTITIGDTLFVLTEGLTVGGKSLREHQELHGHAQALGLMAAWTRVRQPVRIEHLHQLHRAVQTGATIDALAPVGGWKVEPNGTTAITSQGTTRWHDHAQPSHVPALIEQWLKLLARFSGNPLFKRKGRGHADELEEVGGMVLDAYTDVHLGFVRIHPYADGNGRMARLLGNIPVLRAGLPPVLVGASQRRQYLSLMGDYSLKTGQALTGDDLVPPSPERAALREFFAAQWKSTRGLVAEFHNRQASRGAE